MLSIIREESVVADSLQHNETLFNIILYYH